MGKKYEPLIASIFDEFKQEDHLKPPTPVLNTKKEGEKKEKPENVSKPLAEGKKKVVKGTKEAIDAAYLEAFNNAKINRLNKGKEVLPVEGNRNILITSALPYVNNVPHLGNIIGCVLSGDVFARYCRLRGLNAIYICGTDEYGTTTEMKALQEGKTPKQICDEYFEKHRKIYEWFDIDFDYFGRTTTQQQTEIAQHIFNKIKENNFLKYNSVDQTYCRNCDKNLADRYVKGTCPNCKFDDASGDQCDNCGKLLNSSELINPKCQICKNNTELRASNHIFLDLQELQPTLETWMNATCKEGFWSHNSEKTSYAWLNTGLKPRCITRDLKWGTPVPMEEYKDKVFYVWFDAPIGYLSITANFTNEWEKWWKNPENIKLYQFMGKDNIPFHTVIFPSSLLATKENWTMLHHISTTEYLNYEDLKFSKSRGIGVFGDDAIKTNIPPEIWRFYLLSIRPEKADTYFLWKDFGLKTNSELLANIGNLCQRSLDMIYKCEKTVQKVPAYKDLLPSDKELIDNSYSHFKLFLEAFEAVEIRESLRLAMEISAFGNKFFQNENVWEKKNSDPERYNAVLGVMANFIRFLSAVLEPFVPSLSAKINFTLNVANRTERDEKIYEFLHQANSADVILTLIPQGHVINQPVHLVNKC